MSAHVLLNLLNELGKVIKCEACRAFYRFFATSLIKFNNTDARMSDFIYHMTKIAFFGRENIQDLAIFTQRYNSASCSNSILGTQQMLINA